MKKQINKILNYFGYYPMSEIKEIANKIAWKAWKTSSELTSDETTDSNYGTTYLNDKLLKEQFNKWYKQFE
jgi:hypothetical protein